MASGARESAASGSGPGYPERDTAGAAGRVIVIGDALIDEIRDASSTATFVGGAALNVAVGLGVLGIPSRLIAMVGDDADGAAIAQYLHDAGVDLVATPSALGSARAISERVDGEPRYAFNDAARRRRILVDDRVRDALAGATQVVVSCFPLDDAGQVDEVLGPVFGGDRRLVLDPNPRAGMMRDLDEFRRGVERLAGACRLLKIGDEDAAMLYGEPVDAVASRLVTLGAAAVLATSGARGAELLLPNGERVTAPIAEMPGPIVDTMGAGDATLASITASLARADAAGEAVDWQRALDRAMRVAAATCRARGALLRVP